MKDECGKSAMFCAMEPALVKVLKITTWLARADSHTPLKMITGILTVLPGVMMQRITKLFDSMKEVY